MHYSLYSDDSDQSYKIKDECQNITVLYCDLTAETPFVYDVSYHAKVLVNGRAHGSTETRFKPSEHSKNTHTQSYISLHLIVRTIISQYSSIHLFFPHLHLFSIAIFGPPILSTSTTELSLFVNVTLPVGPNGVSIADIIINGRKVLFETKFIYTLNLYYPDWATAVSGNLQYKTYCVHIYVLCKIRHK